MRKEFIPWRKKNYSCLHTKFKYWYQLRQPPVLNEYSVHETQTMSKPWITIYMLFANILLKTRSSSMHCEPHPKLCGQPNFSVYWAVGCKKAHYCYCTTIKCVHFYMYGYQRSSQIILIICEQMYLKQKISMFMHADGNLSLEVGDRHFWREYKSTLINVATKSYQNCEGVVYFGWSILWKNLS